MGRKTNANFISLNIAVLTVNDRRTSAEDTSGDLLIARLTTAGHHLAERALCKGDLYQIRALVSRWIASSDVQVVLISGGTGFTANNITPEAIEVLFDKAVDGFGELFRQLSFRDIGTSTIQSRAVAGLANGTLIAAVPGSTKACATAWDEILRPQLDARQGPCNFVAHLKSLEVAACDSRAEI